MPRTRPWLSLRSATGTFTRDGFAEEELTSAPPPPATSSTPVVLCTSRSKVIPSITNRANTSPRLRAHPRCGAGLLFILALTCAAAAAAAATADAEADANTRPCGVFRFDLLFPPSLKYCARRAITSSACSSLFFTTFGCFATSSRCVLRTLCRALSCVSSTHCPSASTR